MIALGRGGRLLLILLLGLAPIKLGKVEFPRRDLKAQSKITVLVAAASAAYEDREIQVVFFGFFFVEETFLVVPSLHGK